MTTETNETNRTMTRGRAAHRILVTLVLAGACAGKTAAAPTPAPEAGGPASDRLVARLEGVWAGRDNKTPIGIIPFALDFARESDGSLHARTANGPDTYFDFRFHKDERGRWLLTEEGALPGLGVQRETLVPAALTAEAMEWQHAQDADRLRVRIELTPAAMKLQAILRGKPHAELNLKRQEGADADRVRRSLQARATGPAVPLR